MGYLDVQLFQASTTVPVSHPSVSIQVPPNFKIVGGGAQVFYGTGYGSLLTASYPSVDRETGFYTIWNAAAKDQGTSSPATITAYALAINDPDNLWDVGVAIETSDPSPFPTATATLPLDYTLTGGGAFVDYGSGYGSLLTASFPSSDYTWEVRAKQHISPDSARITAYAIGMKSTVGIGLIHNYVFSTSIDPAEYPTAVIDPEGIAGTLTCGGAIDQWTGEGNMLTGSYPTPDGGWFASGKDQKYKDPAVLLAYGISVETTDVTGSPSAKKGK
jgi:hypothetical protein